MGAHFSVMADDITFNPKMLGLESQDTGSVNLDYFSRQNGAAPGDYIVDLYLNDSYVDSRRVTFVVDKKDSKTVRPAFSMAQLKAMGIVVPSEVKVADENEPLPDALDSYIPQARTQFTVKKLRLDLSVPQAALNGQSNGIVAPELWDQGINAVLLNYNYSGSQSQDLKGGGDSRNDFLGIHSGLNVGAWRLRYNGSVTHSSDSGSGQQQDNQTQWQSINTYLQRSYPFWQGSELSVGQYSTPGNVFDSIPFSGVQLASDDDMLPDSMQSFAPKISGIARTTSLITIKQNGNVVYQTTVAPGPYALNDLFSAGQGGDLQVTVRETDGQTTEYTVPFNTLPVLQHEGRYKYALTAGEYHSGNSNTQKAPFFQGTLNAGLPAMFTGFGGIQYADNYTSGSLGIGQNMGRVGALSLNVTQAKSQFEHSTATGRKTSLQYQKSVSATNTTINTTFDRYTEDYFSFSARQDIDSDSGSEVDIYNRTHNKKQGISLSVSQNTDGWGAFSVSGYAHSYYGTANKEKNWQVSYNNSFAGISYTLAYSETKNPDAGDADKRFSLNLSVPLDRFLNNNAMWLNYSMNTTKQGATSHQVGLSGTALEENNLSYNVSQGYTSGEDATAQSGSASLNYKGGYGEANVGYNYDSDSRQLNYGVQGGMLLHQHGLTLSQPLNDTVALVQAPGAENVRIENNNGVRTDWRGYTVVPYLQPYRKNRIYLDSRTFGEGVEMERNINYVTPTKGAVVLANFATHVGRRALVELRTAESKLLPFGADASTMVGQDTVSGIVDESGIVYLAGLSDSGNIKVKWNESDSCEAAYHLPAKTDVAIVRLSLLCR